VVCQDGLGVLLHKQYEEFDRVGTWYKVSGHETKSQDVKGTEVG